MCRREKLYLPAKIIGSHTIEFNLDVSLGSHSLIGLGTQVYWKSQGLWVLESLSES